MQRNPNLNCSLFNGLWQFNLAFAADGRLRAGKAWGWDAEVPAASAFHSTLSDFRKANIAEFFRAAIHR
jgi:hypothetical protein